MNIFNQLQKVSTQPKNFDWAKTCKIRRFQGRLVKHNEFVNPPLKGWEGFKDGLAETTSEKIEEILKRQKVLTREMKKRQKIIQTLVEPEHRWFWNDLNAAYFAEFFVSTKWLRYWLRLAEKVNPEWKEVRGNANSLSDEEIQRAREYPLLDLVEGKVRKSGSKFFVQCPFHEERTPSFCIFPDNSYHCFGCQAHGNNAVDYLMELENLEFPDVVQRLA